MEEVHVTVNLFYFKPVSKTDGNRDEGKKPDFM